MTHAGTPSSPRRVPAPGLELITRLDATLDTPIDLGVTPEGHRRVVPITGGRLHGPRVRGDILPGGADWQIVHPGGWVSVEARYTAVSEAGTPMSIVSRGVRHGPPEVMTRLLAGELIDPSEYRFRTAVSFETAQASEMGWLNHLLAVSSAVREPAAVQIDIYAVT